MSQNMKVDDLRLPATVVGRIVKDALPANASVSKEARTAIARAAAVFVVHLTNYANDYAVSKKKKTLTAEDVVHAAKVIECDNIEKPLKEAIDLWKVIKAQKSEEAKKRKAEKLAEKQRTGDSMEVSTVDEESQPEDDLPDTTPLLETVRDIEDM